MNICSNHNQCIDSAIKRAEALCAERNIQFTKLRKNILKLIWDSHVPLKAYDILEKLKIEELSAKPITVYRILDLFLENKIVHKLESQNRFLGCTHPGEAHNCYFLICKECNKAEEGCEENVLQNIYTNLNKKNFLVDHITLEILGTCKNCAASNKNLNKQ